VSILEAIAKIEEMSGPKIRWVYREEPRKGDHICYISDLRKLHAHFPSWTLEFSLPKIFEELLAAARARHTAWWGERSRLRVFQTRKAGHPARINRA